MADLCFVKGYRSGLFLRRVIAATTSVIASVSLISTVSAQTPIPTVPAANPSMPAANPLPAPSSPASETTLPTDDADAAPSDNEAEPQPAPLVLPESEGLPTANYSDDTMSVDYPVTWQVEIGEDDIVSIQTTEEIPQAITQVFRVAAPPGPLVDANIDSFVEEGAKVARYSSVTIDEQDALVIWLSDRPDELSRAIATFIGYGEETVFLFSRYNPAITSSDSSSQSDQAEPEQLISEQPDIEESLLRLHSSFINLELEPEAGSQD